MVDPKDIANLITEDPDVPADDYSNTFHATINGLPGPERETAVEAVEAAVITHNVEPGASVRVEVYEGTSGQRLMLFSIPNTTDPVGDAQQMMYELEKRY